MKINVLDHGFVRLVSYMQPALDGPVESYPGDPPPHSAFTSWTGDLEIVRNARVSHNADWRTGENEGGDSRLIHSMQRRAHTSPKEAMVFTFEVQAPIFVFRQWHRHRTWSYNELSARYAPMQELFYIPSLDQVRKQSSKDKQATSEPIDEVTAQKFRERMEEIAHGCYLLYQYMLREGVARETARLVLPVNTYSRMFATVDLHNLFHFLRLRLDPHAQYEIRVYAEAMLQLIEPVCPIAVAAFKESLTIPE